MSAGIVITFLICAFLLLFQWREHVHFKWKHTREEVFWSNDLKLQEQSLLKVVLDLEKMKDELAEYKGRTDQISFKTGFKL